LIGSVVSCICCSFFIKSCHLAVLAYLVLDIANFQAEAPPQTVIKKSIGFCVIVSIASSAVQKFSLIASHNELIIACCSSVHSANHILSANHTEISLTLLAVQTILEANHNISHINWILSQGTLNAVLVAFKNIFA